MPNLGDGIDRRLKVVRVRRRIGAAPRERVFTMDLPQVASKSTVLMDDDNISALLSGVEIMAHVGSPTRLLLYTRAGAAVQLRSRLPEAQVVIAPPLEQLTAALTKAIGDSGCNSGLKNGRWQVELTDKCMSDVARKVLKLLVEDLR